jgi:LysR family hydrogen peroxide-inducible transcriptional activator
MRDPLSLKQLRYLVAVADHLNFTRAAQSCHVSQSTLSAGLQELEHTLGVALVERDRRKVLLTEVGHDIADRARQILALAHDLADRAAAALPMSGLLRLGVIPTIAPFLLPRLLGQLRERYPTLKFALREDVTANLLALLAEGELDFALIALPYDTGDLRIEALFDDPLWLVGSAGDPATDAARPRLTAALAGRLLLLEEGHCLRDQSLQACGGGARANPENLEATSLLTLIQMIESGLGIGLVPGLAVASGIAASPLLAVRQPADPVPTRTIALAARRSSARIEEWQILTALLRA